MAQCGSCSVARVKACSTCWYWNECSRATPCSTAFCAAGVQELGKSTVPKEMLGGAACGGEPANPVAGDRNASTSNTTITGMPGMEIASSGAIKRAVSSYLKSCPPVAVQDKHGRA